MKRRLQSHEEACFRGITTEQNHTSRKDWNRKEEQSCGDGITIWQSSQKTSITKFTQGIIGGKAVIELESALQSTEKSQDEFTHIQTF